jgi:hypothetical protein
MIPETQREAYDTIRDKTAKQELVFRALDSYSGLTFFELVKILGWSVNKITGRVNELVKQGRVVDSGERRKNPESTKSGIVWAINRNNSDSGARATNSGNEVL